MSKLADALKHKFGPVADTVGDNITAWRHANLPKPDESEIADIIAEYEAHIADDKTKRVQRKKNIVQKLGLSKAEIKSLKELLEDGSDD